METTPYQPLKKGQSRLMILLPAEDDAPLQCTLQPFYFESPPQYEALSYTWGTAFERQKNLQTRVADILADRKTRSTSDHQAQGGSKMKNVIFEPEEVPELSYDDSGDSDNEPTHPVLEHPSQRLFQRRQRLDSDLNDYHYPLSLEHDNSSTSLDNHLVIGPHTVHLRQNLEQALRNLRFKDRSRTLWVDAICINQADDVERGYQVSQMDRIFESATTVTVWLGKAAEDSDEALQVVRELRQARTGLIAGQHDTQSDWKAFKANFAPYGYLPDELIIKLRAMGYLVNRAWFHRRWVVQEVAFAKDISVQCGRSTVSWDEFVNAVSFLRSHYGKLMYTLSTFHARELSNLWPQDSIHSIPDLQARAASQFLFITKCLLRKGLPDRLAHSHV